MAAKIKAWVVRLASGHVPMISHPSAVASMIEAAVVGGY